MNDQGPDIIETGPAKAEARALDQAKVDAELEADDILHKGRKYPIDETPAA
ncbi:MAG: hypothetical protein WD042_13035 [Phycisphaeraceae bacterium]